MVDGAQPGLAVVSGFELHEVPEPAVGADVGAAEEHGGLVRGGDGGQVGLARAAAARLDMTRAAPRRARRTRRGSSLSTASATTSGSPPVLASPWLTSTRASPCCHSCTGLERCGPTWAKPIASSTCSVSGPDSDPTASSTNAMPAQLRGGRQAPLADRLLEHQDRAHRVDRDPVGVGLAEDVVEDLERQRPVVARGPHVAHEGGQVEPALPREAAVVAAPLEHVHRDHRRVGELEEEDLLAGDLADRGRVAAAREDVERVEAGAEVRMVGQLDDPPGVAVVVDVRCPRPAPRRRCGCRARRPPRRAGAAARPTAPGRRSRRAATLEQTSSVSAPSSLHDLELVARAAQVALQRVGADALEVAERLVHRDREAELVGERADGRGRERRGDQVGLEDLHGVEAGLRGGARASARASRSARRWRSAALTPPAVPRRRSARRRGAASGRGPGCAPVNSSSDPAAWSATMAAPSSVRQPRRARACEQLPSRSACRRPRRPTGAGPAARPARRCRGARPCRWGWRGSARPRSARRSPRSPASAAVATIRCGSASARASARSRFGVQDREPSRRRARGSRGPRPRRRRRRPAGPRGRWARRAGRAAKASLKPSESVLWPTSPSAVEDDRVHRAERVGLGRELVEVARPRAACRDG